MISSKGDLKSTTVTISPSNHFEAKRGNNTIEVPASRLMCLIYTMANAHSTRIRAMRDTWAGDPRLPAISLEHDGPEEYGNLSMWQKIRSIWNFVGTHYLNDYAWFFIGGDDLFVLPHNLKMYLASLTHKDGSDPKTKEYFVGLRFDGNNSYFNSGGAGYALSQKTLRQYMAIKDNCFAKAHTSMEDVMIAACLLHLGISFTDTRDARGREFFHPFTPGMHLNWNPPSDDEDEDWYDFFNEEWGGYCSVKIAVYQTV
ncbi:hypothetical protein ACHAWF_004807 [Thalassiosira exigua]